ncbi:MAG: VWA domain-containing protein [Verrucomicrobiota bacterium]
MRTLISPYLRTLWNLVPPIHVESDELARVFISPHGLHFPKVAPDGLEASWFLAASAHVGAHLNYSKHQFVGADLRPVTQALVGLLEDARVEWLACQELPGLRRLWGRFFAIPRTDVPTFEALMQRLAWVLLEPCNEDPHPWVNKGRMMFFEHEGGVPRLRLEDPEEIRIVASRLGNDIGQMRLQFNARQYRVEPSYRDDNSHLWVPDEKKADVVHELEASRNGNTSGSEQKTAASVAEAFRYPEWDRYISRVRSDWVTVLDRIPEAKAGLAEGRRVLAWRERARTEQRRRVSRQWEGDEFDLDAVIRAEVLAKIGENPDARVYQRRRREREAEVTLFLLDASASTGGQVGNRGVTGLELSQAAVISRARGLERLDSKYAIHSFSSDGRQAVYYERLKDFHKRMDADGWGRLMGVRSQWSTRFGAAMRHATQLVLKQRGARRRVVLFTDGQPHDVDIYDSRYLVEDARQAVLEARQRGVSIQCVCVDRLAMAGLRRVFGAANVEGL